MSVCLFAAVLDTQGVSWRSMLPNASLSAAAAPGTDVSFNGAETSKTLEPRFFPSFEMSLADKSRRAMGFGSGEIEKFRMSRTSCKSD